MDTTTEPLTVEYPVDELSTDALEQQMLTAEAMIGRMRAAQMVLIREADRRQTHTADGCRTMTEWVTARLDLHSDTARKLVTTARRLEALPNVTATANEGAVSFDRVWAVTRTAAPGEDDTTLIDDCWRYGVDALSRLTSRRHRRSRDDERAAFRDRYVLAQPNLDESSWRVYATLPGMAGRNFVDALDAKADQLPNDLAEARTTRHADALWAISLDSLAGSDGASIDSATPLLSVFMDAGDAAPTSGEAGVWIDGGPRVGPDTLEAILCDGTIEVTARTPNGTPLDMGRRSRVISPRLRRFVLARDDGCTVAGCTSRYRLQAHHIIPWSEGGVTDAANLATLCWFHHHVVVHGRGFRIDYDSPPQRRRLLPPIHGPPTN
ncbi:MAG: DUF222 domain-containing protein [Actinomycetota bacterium]|nr:DUF222 domain-containing protein [Actinomycetota bacterium]